MASTVLWPAGGAAVGAGPLAIGIGSSSAPATEADCTDGACVTDVKVGDELSIDPRLGFSRMTVEAVRSGEVDLIVDTSGPPLDLEGKTGHSLRTCLGTNCSESARLTVATLEPARVNTVKITLLVTYGGRAVLALSR